MKNADDYLRIALSILPDINVEDKKHVSFIVRKNKILAVGHNTHKSHPLCVKYNYPNLGPYSPGIHSELASIINYGGFKSDFTGCKLINVRLAKKSIRLNEPFVRMGKPCCYCLPWVTRIFKEIWYTTDDGFVRLVV